MYKSENKGIEGEVPGDKYTLFVFPSMFLLERVVYYKKKIIYVVDKM